MELMSKLGLPELHPDAVALSAFREEDGQGIAYTVAVPTRGHDRIVALVWRAASTGKIGRAGESEYATLELVNAEGDTVQDYAIPTARAFRWWYTLLGLRVDTKDGQPSYA